MDKVQKPSDSEVSSGIFTALIVQVVVLLIVLPHSFVGHTGVLGEHAATVCKVELWYGEESCVLHGLVTREGVGMGPNPGQFPACSS
jgi:hypothetical protein